MLLSVAVIACSNPENNGNATTERPANAPRAVESVELSEGRIGGEVQVRGRIRGRREVSVVSETQGRIDTVNFDLGDEVSAGDVLVRLPSRIEALAVEQAREQLSAARTEVDAVKTRVDRGSATALDLSNARANVSGAEQQLAQAEEAYENRTIRAPISGRISQVGSTISEGDFVQNGATVTRIIDLSRVRLNASVGRVQVPAIQPGQSALVSMRDCEQEFRGTVVAVSAGADPDTGSFEVAIEWDNICGSTLRSGLSASATIETDQGAEGVIVPTAALRSGVTESRNAINGRAELFVVENGRVELREVELSYRLGALAIAQSGVRAGEQVVTSGVTRLRDGDEVAATAIGTSGELE